MTEVLIPSDLWGDHDEAAIATWLYEDGQLVVAGAILAEIMVEKSSYELLAPVSGTLAIDVAAEVGVMKGQRVARIL